MSDPREQTQLNKIAVICAVLISSAAVGDIIHPYIGLIPAFVVVGAWASWLGYMQGDMYGGSD